MHKPTKWKPPATFEQCMRRLLTTKKIQLLCCPNIMWQWSWWCDACNPICGGLTRVWFFLLPLFSFSFLKIRAVNQISKLTSHLFFLSIVIILLSIGFYLFCILFYNFFLLVLSFFILFYLVLISNMILILFIVVFFSWFV